MAGFDNEVMWANNVQFNGATGPGSVTADGQLLIGSTVAPNIRVGTLTSTGGTITITNGAGTINLELAGGGVGIDSIAVQAVTAPGVSPVLPTGAGLLTINGAGVASLGVPVQSRSIALNSLQIEVQRGSAQGASSAANAGLVSLSSGAFSVDANGFVTLLGGGTAATNFTVDAFTGPGTNPVVPTALGNVSITGAQVAAGTNPIRTNSIAANAYQIQVQRSQAVGVSTLTANGFAHFNSAQFTVDANGFVSTIAGTAPWLDSAGGALANHTGYFATAAAVFTLPVGTVNGDMVEIIDQVGGGIVVTAPGAQIIQIQNTPSSAGGTATSTQKGDALRLVFRLADLTWYQCPGAGGIWILA